ERQDEDAADVAAVPGAVRRGEFVMRAVESRGSRVERVGTGPTNRRGVRERGAWVAALLCRKGATKDASADRTTTRRTITITITLLVALVALARAEEADLLVTHGTVVTIDGAHRVIPDGAVAIRGNAIAAVGPAAEITKAYHAKETLDAGGGIVMPGLVNTHG